MANNLITGDQDRGGPKNILNSKKPLSFLAVEHIKNTLQNICMCVKEYHNAKNTPVHHKIQTTVPNLQNRKIDLQFTTEKKPLIYRVLEVLWTYKMKKLFMN